MRLKPPCEFCKKLSPWYDYNLQESYKRDYKKIKHFRASRHSFHPLYSDGINVDLVQPGEALLPHK